MIPEDVQRRMAEFTKEAGTQAATGDRLFGRRSGIARDQNCTCGICLAPDQSTTQCTLLRGPSRVLHRETSSLCKAVCVSRSPVRMLLKFIRSILEHCEERHTGRFRSMVRITLQVDRDPHDSRFRADRPYLLNAYLNQLDHELELDFQKPLDLESETPDVRIHYRFGDDIPEAAVPARVRSIIEQALIDANSKSASLVIVGPDMDGGDFNVGSVQFRDEADGWRSEPVYLYIW